VPSADLSASGCCARAGELLYATARTASRLARHRYGGSAENRCRFALELARAIRAAAGRDYPLEIPLGLEDHAGPGGIVLEEALETLGILHAAGLFDYVSISAGNHASTHRMIPPASSGETAPLVSGARRARGVLGAQLPLMVAAGVRDLATAAAIVRAGDADMVAMTRAQIADPQLVAKGMAGRTAEIRRCVGAKQGYLRRLAQGRPMACTVTPMPAARRVRTGPPAPRRARCSWSGAARRVRRPRSAPPSVATASPSSNAGSASAASSTPLGAWPSCDRGVTSSTISNVRSRATALRCACGPRRRSRASTPRAPTPS